jgi:hypothetical protein
MTTALAIVAILLALVDEIRARGTSLTAWGVVFLGAIFIVGALR